MKNVILHNANCLDIMSKMIESNSKVDLTVTSPPYDNLRSYNNSSIWGEEVWKQVLKGLFEVTKEGGVAVWIVNDATIKGSETGTSFKQALYAMECGFNLHDTMIWKKKNPFNFGSNNCYIQSFEYMFIFSKGKPKTLNLIRDRPNKTYREGKSSFKYTTRCTKTDKMVTEERIREFHKMGKRYNVWEFNSSSGYKEHTATFPISLIEDHILTWSEEGDVVFEPFMGSGTTMVACKNLNRKGIGVEIDETYFNIAKERVENTKLKIRGNPKEQIEDENPLNSILF